MAQPYMLFPEVEPSADDAMALAPVSFLDLFWEIALFSKTLVIYALWSAAVLTRTMIAALVITLLFVQIGFAAAVIAGAGMPMAESQHEFFGVASSVASVTFSAYNELVVEPVNDIAKCFRWPAVVWNLLIDIAEGIVARIGLLFGIDIFEFTLTRNTRNIVDAYLHERRRSEALREAAENFKPTGNDAADAFAVHNLMARAKRNSARLEGLGMVIRNRAEKRNFQAAIALLCLIGREIFHFLVDVATILFDVGIFFADILILAFEDIVNGEVPFAELFVTLFVDEIADFIDPKGCLHPLDRLPRSLLLCLCADRYETLDDIPEDPVNAIMNCPCPGFDVGGNFFDDILRPCLLVPYMEDLLDLLLFLIDVAMVAIAGIQTAIAWVFDLVSQVEDILDSVESIVDVIEDFLNAFGGLFGRGAVYRMANGKLRRVENEDALADVLALRSIYTLEDIRGWLPLHKRRQMAQRLAEGLLEGRSNDEIAEHVGNSPLVMVELCRTPKCFEAAERTWAMADKLAMRMVRSGARHGRSQTHVVDFDSGPTSTQGAEARANFTRVSDEIVEATESERRVFGNYRAEYEEWLADKRTKAANVSEAFKAWVARNDTTRPLRRAYARAETFRDYAAKIRKTLHGDAVIQLFAGKIAALEPRMPNEPAICDGDCKRDLDTVWRTFGGLGKLVVGMIREVSYDEINGQYYRPSISEVMRRLDEGERAGWLDFTEARAALRRTAERKRAVETGESDEAAIRARVYAKAEEAEERASRIMFQIQTVLAPDTIEKTIEELARSPHAARHLRIVNETLTVTERSLDIAEEAAELLRQYHTQRSGTRSLNDHEAGARARSLLVEEIAGLKARAGRTPYDAFINYMAKDASPRFIIGALTFTVLGGASTIALTCCGVVAGGLAALLVFLPVIFIFIYIILSILTDALAAWIGNMFGGEDEPAYGVDYVSSLKDLIFDASGLGVAFGWDNFDFPGLADDVGKYSTDHLQYIFNQVTRNLLKPAIGEPPPKPTYTDDGRPAQTIPEFWGDYLNCNPEQLCSTERDCSGWAPCICKVPGDEYCDREGTFRPFAPCQDGGGSPTGHCFCSPRSRLPGFCLQEVDPDVDLDPRCEEIGFRVSGINPYSEPRGFQRWKNQIHDGWESVKIISRYVLTGHALPIIGVFAIVLVIIPCCCLGDIGTFIAKTTLTSILFQPIILWLGATITEIASRNTNAWLIGGWASAVLDFRQSAEVSTRDIMCVGSNLPQLAVFLLSAWPITVMFVTFVMVGGLPLFIGLVLDVFLFPIKYAALFLLHMSHAAALNGRARAANPKRKVRRGVDIPSEDFELVRAAFGKTGPEGVHRIGEALSKVPDNSADAIHFKKLLRGYHQAMGDGAEFYADLPLGRRYTAREFLRMQWRKVWHKYNPPPTAVHHWRRV